MESERLTTWRLPGILLGIGFGGFFDGIVFHQLLQWHHMLTSAGFPADSIANLRVNTLADGLFHAFTYLISLAGIILLWQVARRSSTRPGLALLFASLLLGWGLFNLVEGLINHFILQVHHVRDDLPPGAENIIWDIAFLLWGAAMIALGVVLGRRARYHS